MGAIHFEHCPLGIGVGPDPFCGGRQRCCLLCLAPQWSVMGQKPRDGHGHRLVGRVVFHFGRPFGRTFRGMGGILSGWRALVFRIHCGHLLGRVRVHGRTCHLAQLSLVLAPTICASHAETSV